MSDEFEMQEMAYLEARIDELSIVSGDDTNGLQGFRHRIMFIHSFIDSRLITIITDNLLFKMMPENVYKIMIDIDFIKLSDYYGSMANYLDNISFIEKVKFFEKAEITRNKDIILMAKELHAVRNKLSHPEDKGYKKYLNLNERIKVYRVTMKLIEELNQIPLFFQKLEQEHKTLEDE